MIVYEDITICKRPTATSSIKHVVKQTEKVVKVMGMSRDVLERQLSAAKALRDRAGKQLSEQGKTDKQYRKDPQWRQIDSTCRSLTRRLARVSQKEQHAVGATDDD